MDFQRINPQDQKSSTQSTNHWTTPPPYQKSTQSATNPQANQHPAHNFSKTTGSDSTQYTAHP